MANESFRDRWRARPIDDTTAGAIADAALKTIYRRLADPELPHDRRNRDEWIIEQVGNDTKAGLGCVKGFIQWYREGYLKV